jgi:hypothetical protein
MHSQGFIPPLDEIDGASRIYDLIVEGINSNARSGKLFRNYLSVQFVAAKNEKPVF